MAWRQRSLAVRIAGLALLVLGPMALAVLFVIVLRVPGSEGVGKMLLMGAGAWMFSSAILGAELFSTGSESSPGPGDGGGGGPGLEQPPSSPTPGGGIPLPDAEQSRGRVRDHDRPRRSRSRRRTREPERPPVPARPGA